MQKSFNEEIAGRLPPVVERRCRFIVEENLRVLGLAAALRKSDRKIIGALMESSFVGARDLFEISAPAMEAMMEAMITAPGIVGARQAGAGFGGCMVAFVEAEGVGEFSAHVSESYESSSGLRPEIYPVRTAAGAGVLE